MFGAKDSRFDKNNTTIDGTNNLTYGIDKKGKMYIYNLGTNKMIFYGDPGQGFADVSVLQSQGHRFKFEGDQSKSTKKGSTAPSSPTGLTGLTGGYAAPQKVFDQAGFDSLQSLLSSYDDLLRNAKTKAAKTRDAALKQKEGELAREKSKYEGKKLTTLQDFAGAKTDTDLNTTQTLENLLSSLSTMGLGGSRALTRQILDAANRSNRQANATQATNNQNLDSAWNEYQVGNEDDINKIRDQYDYDVGEASRKYYQDRQSTLYKQADLYNAVDDSANRQKYMKQGNDLNSLISGSAFLNPRYTGERREMAVPDLADYTQDIAQYNTAGIGGVTPAGGAQAPGNLAMRAVAVNDRDFGIKKKTEGELAYGV